SLYTHRALALIKLVAAAAPLSPWPLYRRPSRHRPLLHAVFSRSSPSCSFSSTSSPLGHLRRVHPPLPHIPFVAFSTVGCRHPPLAWR
ncbi:hypothetical protein PIB30_111576, partial [Stylosanthes scabra]|nr:hypothetical protein [Stylosanthes scabra]